MKLHHSSENTQKKKSNFNSKQLNMSASSASSVSSTASKTTPSNGAITIGTDGKTMSSPATTEAENMDKLFERILKSAASVYRELGPGHSEVVYRDALNHDLLEHKVASRPKVDMVVSYKGQTIGRIESDLIVANKVVVELKTQISDLKEENLLQLHHYLLASRLQHGILINFPKRYQYFFKAITLRRQYSDEEAIKAGTTAFVYRERKIQVFAEETLSPFQFLCES